MDFDDLDIKDACMVSDIKRAFASAHGLCPDVEAELSQFHEQQQEKRQHRIIFRSLYAAVAVAAAMLACVFFIRPTEENNRTANAQLFTASADNRLSVTSDSKTGQPSTIYIKGENIRVAHTNQKEFNTIKTPSGKFFTLLLPDGTVVKLNAQSTFSFPSQFASNRREVYLKGEAYFNVHHDPAHPFVVKTDYFEAKAVGTSFDVRSYDAEHANVTLVEGKLIVSNDKQSPTLIHPNQQTSFNADGTLTTSDTDTYQYTEWRNGIFYFDDISLREVLREMGRWYNIDVEVQNKQALSTKLHFVADRNASISEALKNLNALGHFNIVKKESKIVVK